MITFNTNGMVTQYFPFPKPIMNYIFKNLQPQHFIKLYPTCKFFYAEFRHNIIRHLEIVDNDEDEILDPNKTMIRYSNSALSKLADFWISDSFVYRAPMNGKFLPSFSHCTIKKLELCDYILWQEYKIISKAGTIEELKIIGILDFGDFVAVEDIIAEVPNAKSIEIAESTVTPTTCASLLALNHKANLSNFVLKNIDDFHLLKIGLIDDFLLKNAIASCNIELDFKLLPEVHILVVALNAQIKQLADVCSEKIALRLKCRKFESFLQLL